MVDSGGAKLNPINPTAPMILITPYPKKRAEKNLRSFFCASVHYININLRTNNIARIYIATVIFLNLPQTKFINT